MIDRIKILAIATVFAFLMTGVTVVTDTSDISSADEGQARSITLTETLYFSDQSTINYSVNKINSAAGTDVCKYEDDTLVFTKGLTIRMDTSSSKLGMLVFNAASSQCLSVEEGSAVLISYEGSAVSSDDIGAVIKNGSGSLTLAGKGLLHVTTSVAYTYAVSSPNNFYFDGNSVITNSSTQGKGGILCNNLYYEKDSVGEVVSKTDGIVMKGSEIKFDNCEIKIHASNYGIRCDNLSNIIMQSCNADIIGETNIAFSKNATSSASYMCNIYGTNDVSGTNDNNSIDLSDIDKYKHITIKSQGSIADIPVGIILTVAAILVVAIIIFIFVKKKKNGSNPKTAASEKTPESIYEERTHPASVSRPEEEPVAPSSSKRVEVMTQSLVEGRSFVLIVDGHIVGYIGPQTSFIDVQPGMREISILTNDTERKNIYQKNLIIRPGARIIISKKLGGFRVDIK